MCISVWWQSDQSRVHHQRLCYRRCWCCRILVVVLLHSYCCCSILPAVLWCQVAAFKEDPLIFHGDLRVATGNELLRVRDGTMHSSIA